MKKLFLLIFLLHILFFSCIAQDVDSYLSPTEYVYKTLDSTQLKAYVFSPGRDDENISVSAVLIFHGGGWSEGTPEWAFSRGRHFVQQGMVAVAVQYRLSDKESITPIEAMDDAIDAVRWLRTMADEFLIDTSKVAVYGWSAGGHLAASTTIFNNDTNKISSKPNAVLLVSPALELTNDSWVNQLLIDKAEPNDISPAHHVKPNLPPTIIVHGRNDSVIPLRGVELFTQRMIDAGNVCQLYVYDGVGHMFTPSTKSDKGWPNPDQKIKEEAYNEIDNFLRELGFGNKPY
ncbi:putative lipase/esterase [hydrocarbon metagenome]|uniref:Putative lipase/esterase n=1 Tax=hydrocarbon metagenome TaxID=938273 RepID=A0A0W8FXK9_9ZZZZ